MKVPIDIIPVATIATFTRAAFFASACSRWSEERDPMYEAALTRSSKKEAGMTARSNRMAIVARKSSVNVEARRDVGICSERKKLPVKAKTPNTTNGVTVLRCGMKLNRTV